MPIELDIQKARLLMDQYVGISYLFGAEVNLDDKGRPVPKAIDCSELVEDLCDRIHLWVPDGSQAQYNFASAACDKPTTLDLAFLGKDKNPKKVYHVGILYSDDLILEAKGREYGVVLSNRKDWEKRNNFLGYRRIDLEKGHDLWLKHNPNGGVRI